MPVKNVRALIDDRVEAIRRFHAEAGLDRAQLDVSGGVDSAVMLALLARALGPDRVTAVHTAIDTDPAATERARETAAGVGVPLVELDLSAFFATLVGAMEASLVRAGADRAELDARVDADATVLGSIRSTLRAPVGRGFNRLAGGGVRHGTGNECEDRWLRFFQKGGDGEVDTNPLAMLSKGEVYQLARALEIPRSVLTARPSPDLWGVGDRHADEDELVSVLGVEPGAHSFYSAVDGEGRYARVGLVESVSRFLDEPLGGATVEAVLFADAASAEDLAVVLERAQDSACFDGVDVETTRALVLAARAVERRTRHKANPNCPTLGDRAELVGRGLLDDELPSRVTETAPCTAASAKE